MFNLEVGQELQLTQVKNSTPNARKIFQCKAAGGKSTVQPLQH
jgi:hypothetical protein